MNDGYQTCPNCHRVQSPIFGRLQVFNAVSWGGTVASFIAVFLAFEQVDLARTDREQAEQALSEAQVAAKAANDAREAVDVAIQRAEEAKSDVENAVTAAKESRDATMVAEDIVENAVGEIKRLKELVHEEAEELRALMMLEIKDELQFQKTSTENVCSFYRPDSNQCTDKLNDIAATFHHQYWRLHRLNKLGQKTADAELAFCGLENVYLAYAKGNILVHFSKYVPFCSGRRMQFD